ncbi:hypothetical protein EUX98_g2730, partial [Antrodiella citrinella]
MPSWWSTISDDNVAGPSRLPGSTTSVFGRRASDATMIFTPQPSSSAAPPAHPALPPPLPVPSTPAPGLQYALPAPQQTQPRTVKLTPSAILSLPHRLAHPPPAKGQLPSWGVIPAFDIRLEDILDRKHLPPLGLKDFEEWLLFVDHAAENLYFILWLREYTARYTAWAQQSKREHEFLRSSTSTQSLSLSSPGHPLRTNLTDSHRSPFPSFPNTTFCHSPSSPNLTTADATRYPVTHPQNPSPCPSPSPSPPRRRDRHHHRYLLPPSPPSSLALFYLRAKETFLTPNKPYELDVPSEVLMVFHQSSSTKSSRQPMQLAPPPDPAIFNELASIIEENLKESLAKFVVATYNNVGMPRAHCGSAGGLSIGIIWSAPILAANFSLGGAPMYGVCMMIYIFGDLRQLRSFELLRPQISPPKPLTRRQREKRLNAAEVSASSPVATTARPELRIVPPSPPRVSVESQSQVQTPLSPPPPPAVVHTPVRWNTFPTNDAASFSTSSSYTRSDSASDFGDSDEDDSDEDDSDEDDPEKVRKSAMNQTRRPRIIISDAFYDEHPSPEGPATATTDIWTGMPDVVSGGRGAARRGSTGGVGRGGEGGGPPLWPDYEANEEEEGNATAAFIKPFVYDFENYRFGTAPYMYTPARIHVDDKEAQTQQRTAELQPIESFDFDALPPNRPRPTRFNRPTTWAGPQHQHQPHHSPSSVVGIIHPSADDAIHPSTSARGRKPCWKGQLRMKLGV